MSTKLVNSLALGLVVVAAGLLVLKNHDGGKDGQHRKLLNVSYDPTREVYQALNAKFIEKYTKDSGEVVAVEQSHGGSSVQARSVAEGVAADVVTLALPSDVEILHKRGLIADDWQKKFPNQSQPYFSTIVFVVRKGNPKNISDWPDLITPGVDIITPNPKTSGNGKLSFLAAWGSVIYRGGSEAEARDFVTKIYEHVGLLGQGSRDATTQFVSGQEGDVHLTWENEAIREVAESHGELEIVYPSVSIRAEPSVAVVDANVAKHHSENEANAYLTYLFSDEAQEVFASQGYRPSNELILQKHQNTLPNITLFPVTLVAKDWEDAQQKFFGENGIYELISAPAHGT